MYIYINDADNGKMLIKIIVLDLLREKYNETNRKSLVRSNRLLDYIFV